MPDSTAPFSPFPQHLVGIQVYASASELLGERVSKEDRLKLWSRLADGQALSLIAQILADVEVDPTWGVSEKTEVDQLWAARVSNPRLRQYLSIGSTLGLTLFAPQVLLLAAEEALQHCPQGHPTDTFAGLDVLILCLLGISDDVPLEMTGQLWGGLDSALAAEMIANLHFNRSLSVGYQLVWFANTWLEDWPRRTAAEEKVGGQPSELFRESTGIELTDFATVAFNVYSQAAINKFVRFPDEFFINLGLDEKATDHFLSATARSISELRPEVQKANAASGSSPFGFDVFRQFPLVHLETGQFLVLSPNFVIQRALSETTFWDVREYLRGVDRKREEAFHLSTTHILEHETGAALQRIFSKSKHHVVDEKNLQRKFGSKKQTPSLCDYAVRSGRTWLLVEVTDRPMPRNIVFAKASAEELDKELDLVLTERKANQLASTVKVLQTEAARGGHLDGQPLTFVPVVVTGETALPWNEAVHRRVTERLAGVTELTEDFCSSVALITIKDLSVLENAASHGYEVISLLRSWRGENPGSPLDLYLQGKGVPLDMPKWEKNRASATIDHFASRMRKDAS